MRVLSLKWPLARGKIRIGSGCRAGIGLAAKRRFGRQVDAGHAAQLLMRVEVALPGSDLKETSAKQGHGHPPGDSYLHATASTFENLMAVFQCV